MTTYKQGQVVLCEVPFANEPGRTKKRPVLIVSADWYNQSTGDCIVAAITSNLNIRQKEDIDIQGKEVQEAGLRHPGIIRIGYLLTIQQDRITRVLGALPRGLFARVQAEIPKLFQ